MKVRGIVMPRRPDDLEWDSRYNTPAVMQRSFGPKVRITWNPDDNMFYVEVRSPKGDWETQARRQCNVRGWDNAKYRARSLRRAET